MQLESLKYFRFESLLQKEGWLAPAYVGVNESGRIAYLSNQPPAEVIAVESVLGLALPGFQNAHSHAFQYAMAGLAENHPAGTSDDFWSWREAMYQCALSVDPDQAEAIAAIIYAEMLRHGYTHVAEFHYLHHDKNGIHINKNNKNYKSQYEKNLSSIHNFSCDFYNECSAINKSIL